MITKKWSKADRGALAEHVAELMAHLGDDPLQVARSLADSGVTGVRSKPRGCAINAYLWAIVGAEPGVRSIDVRGRRLSISLSGWRRQIRVAVPPAIGAFIAAFDENRFPELVRNDTRERVDPLRLPGPRGFRHLS